MHFDATISLGNIVTIAAFLVTLLKLHSDNLKRFSELEQKVELMWESFKDRFKIGGYK